jgi:hypothetical protein
MFRATIFSIVLLMGSWAFGQSSSALINQELDKQVKLNFPTKTPLDQIIQAISKDTGVRIEVTPDVYELLPWGDQTAIAAQIENQTLRQALEAITRTLGLQFVLQSEAVEFQPLPALRRIGRRSTPADIEVLNFLASTPLGASANQMTVKELLGQVDAKLEGAKIAFAVENRLQGEGGTQVAVARNATLMDAMEAITKSTAGTWYPWGKSLVVVPKEEPIRNQLAKTITVRFSDMDISQVLSELATRSGVPFTIEPGAVAKVAPEARKVRLDLYNASVQQALESLSGFTGLSYTVNDKGVYIWNPSTGTGTSAREPMFGMLTLDNGMQVLIPQSQVPADLREYLKHKASKQFEKIREMMKEEGYKPPATQPASTQPATAQRDERL